VNSTIALNETAHDLIDRLWQLPSSDGITGIFHYGTTEKAVLIGNTNFFIIWRFIVKKKLARQKKQ